MLVVPIYAGGYERNDGRTAQRLLQGGSSFDDLTFEWTREVRRTIDYLAQRGDADGERVAFVGFSLGAILAPRFASLEPRLQSLVLWSGGFPLHTPSAWLAQALHRTRVPVLMLNGRYDFRFPEPWQKTFLDLLGTPESEKRHVVFEAGHWPFPTGELVRETLAWLDRTLGPVAEGRRIRGS